MRGDLKLWVKVPVIMTVKAVSAHLMVHPDTVRRFIRCRRLKAYRLGDKGSELRIPAPALMAFLEGTTVGGRWLARTV